MSRKVIEGWQGLLLVVGITLGVFPLIQIGLGVGRGGLWRLALGDDAGALRWILPLATLIVTLAAIALLERRKRNT
ncbi:hypothetical protein [Catellatospora sichuanensis]|uniref:hypothetical protein n=1 Tax=Catellatospora sichuanensis TaxID=1969805 RepID=UPI0011821C9D|nr:hypothetical protein [Catellatospora sichuanensis]